MDLSFKMIKTIEQIETGFKHRLQNKQHVQ